ncbi:MAG: DUF4276 family protein [Blastochloris sp.]|nr:DUF4276 family protein [Blastochloris sp.]
MRLEFYVEELSTESALINLVPVILADHDDKFEFDIFTFQGKMDLLKKLPDRLKPYKHWVKTNLELRIIILVDRDDEDCRELKMKLELMAKNAELSTRTNNPVQFHVINRIAIEELEAWFFGDVPAIRRAYPKVSESLGQEAKFRNPDEIKGGTWEQLERVLQDYHPGGLEKIRAAQEISQYMDPDINRSKSFQAFRDALRELLK